MSRKPVGTAVVKPSRPLLLFFDVYLRWYLRRHFHALRVAHAARFPVHESPLIVCFNHPSWWDPLTCLKLSRHLLPQADHYGPMDADALAHYGLLRRLGLFPVELGADAQGTTQGAAQFLRAATHILSLPNSLLWICPQGRFVDARARPAIFKAGLGALLARLPRATVVPIAIEYTFWDERLPEALVNCGEAVTLENVTAEAGNRIVAESLAAAQDELAALAATRSAQRFETVLSGSAGVSGIYGLWQRLRAFLHGEAYRAEHGSIRRRP